MTGSPIEDHLDELLLRTHADPRTTRRLIDEAGDHLYAAAAELEAGGLARPDAEAEAVRRFGPVSPVARATSARALLAVIAETARAAVHLAGCGLAAIGLSGVVALIMNLAVGRTFVGGVSVWPFRHTSIAETADDAVVLRVLAGLVGVLVLVSLRILRNRAGAGELLPPGLTDALGAAAFAAGTAVLTIACAEQAFQNGASGEGFPLSGAVVAFPATIYFCVRAVRAVLPARGAVESS